MVILCSWVSALVKKFKRGLIQFSLNLFCIVFGLILGLIFLELSLSFSGKCLTYIKNYYNRESLCKEASCTILCIGESTTALGGEYSYPRLLEKELNLCQDEIKFSVINSGFPGIDTDYIVDELENNFEKYSPDIVVAMMGINDLRRDTHFKEGLESVFANLHVYKLLRLIWMYCDKIAQAETVVSAFDNYNEELASFSSELYKKANEYYFHDNYAEAEILFREILNQNKFISDKLWWKLLLCLFEQGKYREAEEYIDDCHKRLRWDTFSMFNAKSFLKWHRDAKRILAVSENDAELLADLGFVYDWDDFCKPEKAKMLYLKSLEQEKDGMIYRYLAELFVEQGKYDKAKSVLLEAVDFCEDEKLYGLLAQIYKIEGDEQKFSEMLNKSQYITKEMFCEKTYANYSKLVEYTKAKGVFLVSVQYPTLSVEVLKKMVGSNSHVFFVDNEKLFLDAVDNSSYDDVFLDFFGGSFGHCTPKGNRLLAKNVALVILKDIFYKKVV